MIVIQKILLMLLLKAGPEDLPYSKGLMVRVILLYLFSGMVVVGGLVEPELALVRMLLNIGIIMFFSLVLLTSLELKPRFVQTISAIIGTGIVFNLLAWPVLAYGEVEETSATMQLLSLFVLMLISWEILVTAHIFRNSLNTKMAQAIILSMSLFFVSLTLTQLIFPESS